MIVVALKARRVPIMLAVDPNRMTLNQDWTMMAPMSLTLQPFPPLPLPLPLAMALAMAVAKAIGRG